MHLIRRLLSKIIGRAPRARIQPEAMSEAARQAALTEARKLHGVHAVDVRALKPGEIPIPKQADKD